MCTVIKLCVSIGATLNGSVLTYHCGYFVLLISQCALISYVKPWAVFHLSWRIRKSFILKWKGRIYSLIHNISWDPDNKVHGANMGPTWVLSAPDGPHVGPMDLAIRGCRIASYFRHLLFRTQHKSMQYSCKLWYHYDLIYRNKSMQDTEYATYDLIIISDKWLFWVFGIERV